VRSFANSAVSSVTAFITMAPIGIAAKARE
jgi:hypothetical protein